MINICNIKIDSKGRIQLPRTLLDANGIKVGDTVILKAMQVEGCVRMVFKQYKKEGGF